MKRLPELKRSILGLLLLLGLAASLPLGLAASAAAQGDGEVDIAGILASIDAMSNFYDSDFSAQMTMTTQDPEKGIERSVVRFFRRDREDKFLLLFVEPEAQKGQGYLRDGDSLWFYDPQSRQFSHTSLKEAFEGSDARNSDFSQSSLAKDYRVVAWEPGTLGSYSVYVIDLEATHDEVTYPYLKIWVTRDTHLLLKEEDYSLTKRLMRTSLFPSYAKVGNAVVPRQMIFVDELVPGKQTHIALTDISLEELPVNLFTKSFVERVNR